MVIKGLGVDIEDISRFRETPFEENRSFYQKLFAEEEIQYCLTKVDPYPHFAARFCAKEAFIKANPLFTKERGKLPLYRRIKTVFVQGKPRIEWNNESHFVSLSHDTTKVIAVVVL